MVTFLIINIAVLAFIVFDDYKIRKTHKKDQKLEEVETGVEDIELMEEIEPVEYKSELTDEDISIEEPEYILSNNLEKVDTANTEIEEYKLE